MCASFRHGLWNENKACSSVTLNHQVMVLVVSGCGYLVPALVISDSWKQSFCLYTTGSASSLVYSQVRVDVIRSSTVSQQIRPHRTQDLVWLELGDQTIALFGQYCTIKIGLPASFCNHWVFKRPGVAGAFLQKHKLLINS